MRGEVHVLTILKIIKIPGQWTRRSKTNFSHCLAVPLQFILFNPFLSRVVCSDEMLWPTSDFFWRLVMNDDDWSWMMVNTPRKKGVCEVMRWCECSKCKIFHHTKIYRIYRIYKIYHSFLYTLQYLHFPWFLQPGWTKSSLSALKSGVQTCTLLLHCKCYEPWQAQSSLSTFQWDWKTDL